MLMAEAAEYRRFRAPQDDGQTLVEPPRPTLGDLIARNRTHLAGLDYDVQGRSLAELAASARRSLVDQAVAYTSRYRECLAPPSTGRPMPTVQSSSPATSHNYFTRACGTRISCSATWPRKSAVRRFICSSIAICAAQLRFVYRPEAWPSRDWRPCRSTLPRATCRTKSDLSKTKQLSLDSPTT